MVIGQAELAWLYFAGQIAVLVGFAVLARLYEPSLARRWPVETNNAVRELAFIQVGYTAMQIFDWVVQFM